MADVTDSQWDWRLFKNIKEKFEMWLETLTLHIYPTAGVPNVLSCFSFYVLFKNLPDAGESHCLSLIFWMHQHVVPVFYWAGGRERCSCVTALYLAISLHLYHQILICTDGFGRFLKSDPPLGFGLSSCRSSRGSRRHLPALKHFAQRAVTP